MPTNVKTNTNAIQLGVNGAAGRMGQRIVALAAASDAWRIVAALERPGHPALGQDAGQLAAVGNLDLPLTCELQSKPDVVIDFSVPQGTHRIVEICRARAVPLVIATTGLEAAEIALIDAAAKEIPILRSPSMSLAVNLTMRLSAIAAQALRNHPGGVDVEIIECHHRFKEDAPSGTALKFGEIISRELGSESATHGRQGRPGVRPSKEIGYHAVRAGDNPGEHTILFGLLGESIGLSVRATSRDCYAQGALAAARYLVGKPAGLYNMTDVLGV